MPSFEQEYECLHHYVALRDLTQDMYILKFPRNNCLDFLHRISTNSLRDLPVYCFQKTIFTTDKGRIIDTAYILHLEDQVLLIAHSVHQKKLLDWLQRYAILEDITIERSQKYVLVEILGKKAKTVLSENLKLPILHENKIYMSTLANQNFYLFSTSNYPYSVYCLIDRIISLAIIQENLEKFGISIYQISGFTYNIYRIEYGIPIAPYELNETINPHEACLLDAVNFTKGCYIGQEVIARLRTYDKVQKYLTGIILDEVLDTTQSSLPMSILSATDMAEIGQITSLAYSPHLQKTIGLGYIRKNFKTPGQKCIAQGNQGQYSLQISSLPFL